MIDGGYRELHLTGVNTGAYGRDRDDSQGLAGLVKALLQVDGLLRLRLGSVEPRELSTALIDLVASSPRVCRHFHVPLQSGDDGVLRRMGRQYSAADYAERLVRLAGAVPDCAIGADVLVGFPGETEAAYGQTAALVRQLPLTYLHVFPYSVRSGTPAARWSDAPASADTRARVQELIELGQRRRLLFHQRFVGRHLGVLTEEQHGGTCSGLSDNYIKATYAGVGALPNALVTVRVTEAGWDGVHAEVLP
jgi:threonylcarbamoyladenosine tRNA methylthiotransferase MtaB